MTDMTRNDPKSKEFYDMVKTIFEQKHNSKVIEGDFKKDFDTNKDGFFNIPKVYLNKDTVVRLKSSLTYEDKFHHIFGLLIACTARGLKIKMSANDLNYIADTVCYDFFGDMPENGVTPADNKDDSDKIIKQIDTAIGHYNVQTGKNMQ